MSRVIVEIMTTRLGSQTFANIIWSHSDLPFTSQKDEEEDNSSDAGSTYTKTCYREWPPGSSHGVSYMHMDNGCGMEPNKLLSASNSVMKNNDSIGRYYRGALLNLLSKKATTTYQFSRQAGKPLMMLKYKISKMFTNVNEGMTGANGEKKSGETITDEIFNGVSRTIYGPYIWEHEDSGITDGMLDDSINLFRGTNDEIDDAIKLFLTDSTQTGTVFVSHWDNTDLCKFKQFAYRKLLQFTTISAEKLD